MRRKKEQIAALGLLLITVWAAIQYVFLQNVPDSVSTFSFLFITYLAGFVLLAAVQARKLKFFTRRVLLKGMLFAGELLGFNFFMLIGSRGLDSVIVSSLVSMYFIFVTPALVLLKKKVSFRSAVASAVAVIALILMFNADIGLFFSSPNVIYLLIADLFFAAYVITVSAVGEKEDSAVLTLAQMVSSSVFSLAGWCVEVAAGKSAFAFPSDRLFWVAVLFYGVFIRALYGLLQVSCQKYVKPVNASLIFSSEIIITLLTTPFLSRLLRTDYTPATVYQAAGCVFFVIAVLIVDDGIMSHLGYTDMDTKTWVDENGVTRVQSSVSRKLTNMTLLLSMAALLISTVICIASISSIKSTAVQKSTELGQAAAGKSEEALKAELETELLNTGRDKALIAEQKLRLYAASARYAADYAALLYNNPQGFPEKEVLYPRQEYADRWAMQRYLAEESIPYAQVEQENRLLGNLEGIFQSIVDCYDNISTIYIGTESGLLLSYDPNSAYANVDVENYYEFRERGWYQAAREASGPFFTKAYQDDYGRGLTITCAAPIRNASGQFKGCIGIDILMDDINSSMVNDNIDPPQYGVLLNSDGSVIAGGNVDRTSSGMETIYDADEDDPLRLAAKTVLSGTDGVTSVGEGGEAIYIAYSRIPLTDWILCIVSPVSDIIKPAVSIRDDITTSTGMVAGIVNDSIRRIINSCLILFELIILAITGFVGRLSERITSPIRHLEQDVMEISCGRFDRRTQVFTDDEIGSLARAFNHMTESLQEYMDHLKEMTAKEERIASELSLAKEIQAGVLPKNFSGMGHGAFSICADMAPAKEVGGDFYDFFLVDDDHLALVIADVSGKGVPAALFMMHSRTLIRSAAQAGLSPSQVLERVNNQLLENNEEQMFVTVWLGILRISTGDMACANAGHEYPAVRLNGGAFELWKDPHGLVLAGMEDMKYREYELSLAAGDCLFVYTDGVTEAADSSSALYGTERMLAALNRDAFLPPAKLICAVKQDISRFAGEAEQFDDITMLCVTYHGCAAGQDGGKSGEEKGS